MAKKDQQGMFPTKKKNSVKRIYNINAILERKYQHVKLNDYYKSILGEIEGKCIVMIYGPSASGKSVFTLQLA